MNLLEHHLLEHPVNEIGLIVISSYFNILF